jgi:small nuclear ribonucleoprotein (snRNP)-like protein
MAARDRLIRKALRERFVVTLTSGETFDGLLIDVDDRTLTLANAYAISGSERVKVDGLLYLPRPVAYMQKPEASG